MTTVMDVFEMLQEVWQEENAKRVNLFTRLLDISNLEYAYFLNSGNYYQIRAGGEGKSYVWDVTIPEKAIISENLHYRFRMNKKKVVSIIYSKHIGPVFEDGAVMTRVSGRIWEIFSRQDALCFRLEGGHCYLGIKYQSGEVFEFGAGDAFEEYPPTIRYIAELGEVLKSEFPDNKVGQNLRDYVMMNHSS